MRRLLSLSRASLYFGLSLFGACATLSAHQRALEDLDDPDRREAALNTLAALATVDGDPEKTLLWLSETRTPLSGPGAVAAGLAHEARGELGTAIDRWLEALAAPELGARRAALGLLQRVSSWIAPEDLSRVEAACPSLGGVDEAICLDLRRAVATGAPGDSELEEVTVSRLRTSRPVTRLAFDAATWFDDAAARERDGLALDGIPAPFTLARGELAIGNVRRALFRIEATVTNPGRHWLRVESELPLRVYAVTEGSLQPLWDRADLRTYRPKAAWLAIPAGTRSIVLVGAAARAGARLGLKLHAAADTAQAVEAQAVEAQTVEAQTVEAPAEEDPSWPTALADLLTAIALGDADAARRARLVLDRDAPSLAVARLLGKETDLRTVRHVEVVRRRAADAAGGGRLSEALRELATLGRSDDPRDALLGAEIAMEAGQPADPWFYRARTLAPWACTPWAEWLEARFARAKLGSREASGKSPSIQGIPPRCQREPEVARLLTQLHVETGALAEPLVATLVMNEPESPRVAAIYERRGEKAPPSPTRDDDPASLERRAGQASPAGSPSPELLERAWRSSAGGLETRLRLLTRGVGRELMALAPDIESALARALEPSFTEGRNAVVLLDHAASIRFADGTGIQHVRQVMRLLTPSACEEMGEADVPENGVLIAALTHKADGRVLRPEEFAEKASVSFPELEPGDAIQLEYLVSLEPDVFYGGGFLESSFYFNLFEVPVVDSTYIALAPPPMAVNMGLQGAVPDPVKVSIPGFEGLRFHVGPSQGVVGEPETLSPLDALSQVRARCLPAAAGPEFHPAPNGTLAPPVCGTQVVDGIALAREALLPLLAADDALRDRARSVAAVDGTPAAHVAALWSQVQKDVREDDGAWLSVPATAAFESGSGERAIALLAALLAAGFEADLVLAPEKDSGAGVLDWLNPRVYGHKLVRVLLAEGPVFIDPQLPGVPPGHLTPTVLGEGAYAIGLRAGIEALTLPLESPSGDRRRIDVVLDVGLDGRVRGTWAETALGFDAVVYRSALEPIPAGEWNARVGPLVERVLPGATAEAVEIDGLGGEGPLSLRYRFGRDADARLDLRLLPAELASRFATLPERRTDLVVGMNDVVTLTVRVQYPPGRAPAVLPAPVTLAHSGARYSRTARRDGDAVVLERELTLRPYVVKPSEYEAFRRFVEGVDAADVLSLGP